MAKKLKKSTAQYLFHKGHKTMRRSSLSLKSICCNDHKEKNIYKTFIKRFEPKSQPSAHMDISNF